VTRELQGDQKLKRGGKLPTRTRIARYLSIRPRLRAGSGPSRLHRKNLEEGQVSEMSGAPMASGSIRSPDKKESVFPAGNLRVDRDGWGKGKGAKKRKVNLGSRGPKSPNMHDAALRRLRMRDT